MSLPTELTEIKPFEKFTFDHESKGRSLLDKSALSRPRFEFTPPPQETDFSVSLFREDASKNQNSERHFKQTKIKNERLQTHTQFDYSQRLTMADI